MHNLKAVCVSVLIAQSYLPLCDPMNCSPPVLFLSLEFFRQKYWNGSPFPSPGDLTDQGIEPVSPTLQVDSLLSTEDYRLTLQPVRRYCSKDVK